MTPHTSAQSLSARAVQRGLYRTMETVHSVRVAIGVLLEGLPAPSREDFEAMRAGAIPWSQEAHLLAVLREVDFHLSEVAALVEELPSPASLRRRWRRRDRIEPRLERSLGYVVEKRLGAKIPPGPGELGAALAISPTPVLAFLGLQADKS